MIRWILIILLGMAAAIGGFALRHSMMGPSQITDTAPVPGFSIADLNGELVSASDYAGRYVLINFWATWCPPCRKEIPELIELQNKYGADRLQVIGIALDQRDRVVDYASDMGMNYPALVIEGPEGFDLMDAFGAQVGGLPFNVLIKPDGSVAMRVEGAVTGEEIESLLK